MKNNKLLSKDNFFYETSSDPSGSTYDVYFNTTIDELKYYNGSFKRFSEPPKIVNGRLTGTSGSPLADNVSSISTLYFTPYNGNRIVLLRNSVWKMYEFSEVSLSISGLSDNYNYDVFIYDNSGTITLATNQWTNDSTRANNLSLIDGLYTYNNMLYLGTIRTPCNDTITKRYINNLYNSIYKNMYIADATGHTYTTNSLRYFNNNSSNKVEFVSSIKEECQFFSVAKQLAFSSNDSLNRNGIGLNTSTISSSTHIFNDIGASSSSYDECSWCFYNDIPSDGYNYLSMLEYGYSNVTFNYAMMKVSLSC